MIDKRNEGFDDLDKLTEEFEFDDDLDLESDSAASEELDLGNDDLATDESFHEDFSTNVAPKTNDSTSFLKNYGIVIVVVLVFGYFAFKYTSSMFLGQKQPVQQVKQAVDPKVAQTPSNAPAAAASQEQASKAQQEKTEQDPMAGIENLDIASDLKMGTNTPSAAADSSELTQESLNINTEGMKSLSEEKKVAVYGDGSAVDFRDSENAQLATKINELLRSIETISTKIDQKASKNTSDVDNVKNLVTKVNSKMTEVADYVQSAGKAIGLLSKQVKYQELVLASIVGSSVDLSGATAVNSTANSSSSSMSEQENKVSGLTVDAISSGRAWLKTSNGKAMNVAVGDDIPGYGRVVDINTINATVTTDKGKIIK